MTVKTRRRLIVCAVVLALALPLESILLQALSTPDSTDAISQWASDLSSEELDAAASQIQSYPQLYRREVMRALSPDRRAGVWRKHLEGYVAAHPELDDSARQLIGEALALIAPETFGKVSAEVRGRTRAIADQLVALIGREATLDLLYRLGPRDGTFASLEPVRLRLANYIRGVMVAMADEEMDCNCSTEFGCDGTNSCSTSLGCTPDEDWPMCGWFWNDICNGKCVIREMN